MDGIDIINSFKKETSYEFSEAISIIEDEIYFIFKVDIISIETNPSKPKTRASHLEIEPIAYLLKRNKYDYQIEAIDKRHKRFIEKNKDKLLKEFLNRKNE